VPKFLKFTYSINLGGAFNIFWGQKWLFITAALIVTAIILYYVFKISGKDNRIYPFIGLGLLVGGTLGNLFDRVVWGYVIDFIDLGWWPAFNLADIFINIGLFITLIYLFTMDRGKKKKGGIRK